MKQDKNGCWRDDAGRILPKYLWPDENHPTQSISAQQAANAYRSTVSAGDIEAALRMQPAQDCPSARGPIPIKRISVKGIFETGAQRDFSIRPRTQWEMLGHAAMDAYALVCIGAFSILICCMLLKLVPLYVRWIWEGLGNGIG